MKQLPFSKVLSPHLIARQRNEVFVFCGSRAWDYKNHSSAKLLLPPGGDPAQYEWQAIRGRDVLVFACGNITDHALLKLAHVLLHSGATIVRIADQQHRLSVHRPITAGGVAHAA